MPKRSFAGLSDSKGEVSSGFDPWKPGTYLLECVGAKWGETRVAKDPQLEVKTTIVGVEDEDLLEDQDPIGKPYTFWLPVNEKEYNLNMLKALLNACSIRVTNDEFDEAKLVGKQFLCKLTIKKGDNKPGGGKWPDRNRASEFAKYSE